MSTLRDQVAVITGASSGIGKAIAIALASQSASLSLIARDEQRLEVVAAEARKTSPRVNCYAADLAKAPDICRATQKIRSDFGHVDVLVHSAGAISLAATEQARIEDFDRQYAVNVRGPYLLTQQLLPIFRNESGQIVFINSTAGQTARAKAGQYAASKHALRAVADSLREEVNPRGIRVLSVYLGRTATPMQASVFAAEGRSYQPELLMQAEDVAALVMASLTLPRTAEVTEIVARPLMKSY